MGLDILRLLWLAARGRGQEKSLKSYFEVIYLAKLLDQQIIIRLNRQTGHTHKQQDTKVQVHPRSYRSMVLPWKPWD